MGDLFSPPVSNDSCEPYYTYHIIPEIIPNGRTDIDFLDITRTETRITFKNKSVLLYRYIPGVCKKCQDSFGENGLFFRIDMNQNTLMEGDIIIFQTNAPDVDVYWINPESTISGLTEVNGMPMHTLNKTRICIQENFINFHYSDESNILLFLSRVFANNSAINLACS